MVPVHVKVDVPLEVAVPVGPKVPLAVGVPVGLTDGDSELVVGT